MRQAQVIIPFVLLPLLAAPAVALEADRLSVAEGKRQITIRDGAELILSYNKLPPDVPPGIDRVYRRSGFLHPVASPHGGVVTAAYPVDHAHQNGIFAAWVKTTYDSKPVDFWNLAKKSGRVKHDRVVSTFCDAEQAGFEVELLHQVIGEEPLDVLRETWRITCYRNQDGRHIFDLESTQRALTDQPLIVEEYHYGGMAVRGPTEWIVDASDPESNARASVFLNSLGSARVKGNHEPARWVSMTGTQHGSQVTVTMLSHQDNFRAPQPARLHPTKPYFCFAPCVKSEFVIDKSNPLHSRYRFVVSDAKPDATWLDEHWRNWCAARAMDRQ